SATSAVANITVLTTNLVQNGSFETGSFAGWTLIGSPPVSGGFYNSVGSIWDTIHSGIYGAYLGDIQLASLSQAFSTVQGQCYLLGLWLDNPTSGANQYFTVNWTTKNAATNTVFSMVNPPAFSWTKLQSFVTATDTNSTLEIHAENDPGYFGLD